MSVDLPAAAKYQRQKRTTGHFFLSLMAGQGQLRCPGRVGTGKSWGKWGTETKINVSLREKIQGVGKIREKHNKSEKRRGLVPQRWLVFKHLPVHVYAEGRDGCLIPLHFYYSCS